MAPPRFPRVTQTVRFASRAEWERYLNVQLANYDEQTSQPYCTDVQCYCGAPAWDSEGQCQVHGSAWGNGPAVLP
jgi:hypothetical protein